MDYDPFTDICAPLSEANRPIRLRLSNGREVLDDVLLVKRVSGTETICGGLEYTLSCVATRAGIPLKRFIANAVEVQFVTDRGGLRSVCGIVSSACEGLADGGLATYQLVLRDALALLDMTCNTRVFRQANEVDITNVILREWREACPAVARAFNFDLSALRSYPARELTMQYNESSAAFLKRLWKRRGIAWFVRAGRPSERGSEETAGHTLVLFDDAMSLRENAAGSVCFHSQPFATSYDSIHAWHAVRSMAPGRVVRRSWDYAQAWSMGAEHMTGIEQGEAGSELALGLEEYYLDVPHVADDARDYQDLGKVRAQSHEMAAKYFHGEGGVRDMCCGEWFAMSGHAEVDTHPAEGREFVITELHVEAANNLPKELDATAERLFARNNWEHAGERSKYPAAQDGLRYTNSFSCVRRGIPIVPVYDARVDLPTMQAQSVTVVGPANEEIHCDEHGRVKVRFHGCRVHDHAHAGGAGASGTDRDSAWVRVASGWAGAGYGAVSLPRVGDEVIVIFMGGDPDKPLIMGRVHGGKTPPPCFSHRSVLPGDKHLSGIVSKEAAGQRNSQLRMDDTPGQISAQLASEHGNSQLNLGFLTHPRQNTAAAARGEGAELRTDQSVTIRGAQGVLITAEASLRASGGQLDREGLTALTQTLAALQEQLAGLTDAHLAEMPDEKPFRRLAEHLGTWQAGSNVDPAGKAGGAPIVAIQAPGGVVMGSSDNVAIGAMTAVDIASAGNTQLSAGRKLLVNAMQSISLFAHRMGIKLVAGSGKLELQAHDDDIELTAAKRVVLTATDEIVLQAPKVTIISQGAQTTYGGGVVHHQCTGAYKVNAVSSSFDGPAEGSLSLPELGSSSAQHTQRVRLTDMGTGSPLARQAYRATLEDGQIIEGITDDEGLTEELKSDVPFARFTIEALFD